VALAGALAVQALLTTTAGNPVKRVAPEYPLDAARAGTAGYVVLEYIVGPDGNVTDVSVVEARPRRVFVAAAIKAVKQWEFAPGSQTRGRVRLEFRP
jgi:protein TonB